MKSLFNDNNTEQNPEHKKVMFKSVKDLVIAIITLLGGIAFTVTSFCVCYLAKPVSIVLIIAICAMDFFYSLFSTCILFKYIKTKKWLLKGSILSVGYIIVFIAVCALIFISDEAVELLKNRFIGAILLAFFTSPCIFIVLAILLLILAIYS